jgi:hypothetical protein
MHPSAEPQSTAYGLSRFIGSADAKLVRPTHLGGSDGIRFDSLGYAKHPRDGPQARPPGGWRTAWTRRARRIASASSGWHDMPVTIAMFGLTRWPIGTHSSDLMMP